jgi:predicted aspartyl protease
VALTVEAGGSRFPYIRVRLTFADENQSFLSVEGMVDTGFDGDIVLPDDDEFLGALGQADYYLIWRLADGSRVLSPAYSASAELADIQGLHEVVVSFLGDEALIGRGLTDRFKVVLDHGMRVIVEQ